MDLTENAKTQNTIFGAIFLSNIVYGDIRVGDLTEVEQPYSYDFCSCGCGETPDECNEDLSVKRKK